jgi:hypothetical protein
LHASFSHYYYYHDYVIEIIFAAVVQIECGLIGSALKAVGKSAAATVAATAVITGAEKVIDKIKG